MANQLVIKLTAEEAEAYMKLRKMVDVEKELGDEVVATGHKSKRSHDEVKESIREENEALRRAQRLIARNRTEQERFADAIADLKLARDKGKISERQYNREVDRTREKMLRAEEAQQQVVGEPAQNRLDRFVGKWGAVAAGIGVAVQGLQEFKRVKDEALQESTTLQDSRKLLAQVSSGDFLQLDQRADSVAGSLTREEARRLLFQARSQGFERDFEFVAGLDPILDANVAGGVAGKVTNLFQGRLSSRQAIEGTFAAAQASDSDFSKIAEVLPIIAANADAIKATPQEQLGAISVLSEAFKSAETAATRIAALESRFAQRGEEFDLDPKSGLLGGVRGAVETLDDQELKKFLGESREVNEAFNAIVSRFQQIEDRTTFISESIDKAGTDQALTRQSLNEFLSVDVNRALLSQQRATVENEIRKEQELTVRAANEQAVRKNLESFDNVGLFGEQKFVRDLAVEAAQNVGLTNQGASRAVQTSTNFLNSPFGAISSIAQDPADFLLNQSRQIATDISQNTNQEQTEVLKQIEQNTSQPNNPLVPIGADE